MAANLQGGMRANKQRGSKKEEEKKKNMKHTPVGIGH
jgi:hypothetical protein